MDSSHQSSTLLCDCSTELVKIFGYGSFSDFRENESKKHKGPCTSYWRTRTLCINCGECCKMSSSIMCLPCFLNGNHEGHSIIVKPSDHGFCDCGNPLYTAPEGHCCKHAQSKDDEYMEEDKKNAVIDILAGLLNELPELIKDDEEQFCEVTNWILSICQIGKCFGNCVVDALDKEDTLNILFKCSFQDYTNEEIEAIQKLINQLIVNPSFYVPFGRAVFLNIFKFIEEYNNCINESKSFDDIEPLTESFFTIFEYNTFINSCDGDTSRLVDFIDIIQKQIKYSIDNNGLYTLPPFLNDLFCGLIQKSQNIEFDNSFICKYLDTILDKNFIVTTNIDDKNEKLNIIQMCYSYFSWIIDFARKAFIINNFDLNMIIEKYLVYYKNFELNYSILDGSPILLNYIPVFSLWDIFKSRNDIKNILKGKDDFLNYLITNLIKIVVSNFFSAHNIIPGCFDLINYSFLLNIYYDECASIVKFIQLCFSCYSNKEELISNILKTFGFFAEFGENNNNLIYFDFIYFISLIITSNETKEDLILQSIASKILLNPKPFKEFSNIFELNNIKKEEKIKKYINSISTQIHSNEILYKLKSFSSWNPISGFQQINIILSNYTQIIDKYKNEFLPFRKVEPNSNNQELLEFLFSPSLLAIEYLILLNKTNTETNHLILNLLSIALDFDQTIHKTTDFNCISPITVKNFQELRDNIPNNNFAQIMNQKFIYQNNKPMSFIDLIRELGGIGQKYLKKMKISTELDDNVQEQSNIKKERINLLKQKIISNYETMSKNFENANDISSLSNQIEDCHETCCSCRQVYENEILLYPMYSYKSSLPCLYDGDPFGDSYTFTICLHPVHRGCLEKVCPLDKGLKNSFLPNLDDIENLSQENVKNILFEFKDQFSETNIQVLLISLCSLIVSYEVLLRSNPCYLNNKKYYVLARNLFLCIKELNKNGIQLLEPESEIQMSYFQHFIIELIQDESKLQELVEKYSCQFMEGDLILFLRRVRLSEYFLLGHENNIKFNWDYVLSPEDLCKRYNIPNDENEYDFPPFLLYELPHKFLDLGKTFSPEFISTYEESIFLNLLNGEIFTLNKVYYYMSKMSESFMLAMVLNISHSGIYLFKKEIINRRTEVWVSELSFSIYQNFLGEPDPGFKQGFQLFLNEAKYEELANDFISGNILSKPIRFFNLNNI